MSSIIPKPYLSLPEAVSQSISLPPIDREVLGWMELSVNELIKNLTLIELRSPKPYFQGCKDTILWTVGRVRECFETLKNIDSLQKISEEGRGIYFFFALKKEEFYVYDPELSITSQWSVAFIVDAILQQVILGRPSVHLKIIAEQVLDAILLKEFLSIIKNSFNSLIRELRCLTANHILIFDPIVNETFISLLQEFNDRRVGSPLSHQTQKIFDFYETLDGRVLSCCEMKVELIEFILYEAIGKKPRDLREVYDLITNDLLARIKTNVITFNETVKCKDGGAKALENYSLRGKIKKEKKDILNDLSRSTISPSLLQRTFFRLLLFYFKESKKKPTRLTEKDKALCRYVANQFIEVLYEMETRLVDGKFLNEVENILDRRLLSFSSLTWVEYNIIQTPINKFFRLASKMPAVSQRIIFP
jgi:hypothetical protein